MRSQYCVSCGSKNEFTYQPPKFCNNCGDSFQSLSFQSKKEKKPIRDKSLAEDQTDIDRVPKISNFEYEIDIPHDNIHKMSELLNEGRKGNEEL